MELAPFVARLRTDLSDAAAAGGEETRTVAERLVLALDPATRMVLIEALAQAAAEISGALDHETVDVRINGREPEFVVTRVTGHEALGTTPEPAPAPEPIDAGESDDLSRISLRLPESVKTRAEERAASSGRSLNAWLVDAVRAALDGPPAPPTGRPQRDPRGTSVRGWVS